MKNEQVLHIDDCLFDAMIYYHEKHLDNFEYSDIFEKQVHQWTQSFASIF